MKAQSVSQICNRLLSLSSNHESAWRYPRVYSTLLPYRWTEQTIELLLSVIQRPQLSVTGRTCSCEEELVRHLVVCQFLCRRNRPTFLELCDTYKDVLPHSRVSQSRVVWTHRRLPRGACEENADLIVEGWWTCPEQDKQVCDAWWQEWGMRYHGCP